MAPRGPSPGVRARAQRVAPRPVAATPFEARRPGTPADAPQASLRVLDAGLGAAAARWAHDVSCAQGVASCAANDARGPSSRGCCHAPPEARAAHAALLAWYADLERRAGSGAEANGSTWASAYDRGVSLLAAAAASGLVAAAGAPYTHFLPELLALVPDLRVAQTLGPAEEWASRHAAPRRDGARGESVACAEDVVRRFGLASYFDLRCLAADRAAASAPFVPLASLSELAEAPAPLAAKYAAHGDHARALVVPRETRFLPLCSFNLSRLEPMDAQAHRLRDFLRESRADGSGT